jgi:hypothetical protein
MISPRFIPTLPMHIPIFGSDDRPLIQILPGVLFLGRVTFPERCRVTFT